MLPQDLNQNSYILSVTSTAANIQMSTVDGQQVRVILQNLGSNPCIVLASGAQNTALVNAVYPTSATTGVAGQVIPAGAIVTYSHQPGNIYLSAICASGLTTTLVASPATGD